MFTNDVVSCILFDRYLHSTGHTYGRPINGQREISGYPTANRQNLWKAMVCSLGFVLHGINLLLVSGGDIPETRTVAVIFQFFSIAFHLCS